MHQIQFEIHITHLLAYVIYHSSNHEKTPLFLRQSCYYIRLYSTVSQRVGAKIIICWLLQKDNVEGCRPVAL